MLWHAGHNASPVSRSVSTSHSWHTKNPHPVQSPNCRSLSRVSLKSSRHTRHSDGGSGWLRVGWNTAIGRTSHSRDGGCPGGYTKSRTTANTSSHTPSKSGQQFTRLP